MNSMDLSPLPARAPKVAMVRSQTFMEVRLLVRNGEQLLLTVVIPLLLLIVGSQAGHVVDLGSRRAIDVVTPGILALAVMSTSFTSLAIATGFERRYGVLKHLGSTPLPRWGLLLGKVCAIALVEVGQVALLCVVAFGLGWAPSGGPTQWLCLVVMVALGTFAFGSLALLIAGILRAEITLAVANLIYFLLVIAGGIVVPANRYPASVAWIVELLPSGALGEGMRQAFTHGSVSIPAVAVLLMWSLLATWATARSFTWE
jgi:ABC-2 type transport system permease protein